MANSTKLSPKQIKGTPLLGHLLKMKREGVYFYFNLFKEHGDAMSLKIAHKKLYLFFHPEAIKEILVDNPNAFIKGKQYESLRLVLGNGLLTSEGEDWNRQRRLLNPIFGKVGLDLLLKHIEKVTIEFIDKNFSANTNVNWTKLMFDYTLEVAIVAFFGSNFQKQKKEIFSSHCHNVIRFVSKRMSNVFALPLSIPTKENIEFKNSLSILKEMVTEVYNEKLRDTKSEKFDLIDQLISAEFKKEEIWDQIISFLIAGHETTALTMSWEFYLLAQNPQYQNLIVEESLAHNFMFNDSLSPSDYPMTSAVINETMRLYPSGWIIARDIALDTKVGDYLLKKGNIVAVSPLVTHRDPRFFPMPDSFIPERFIPGSTNYQEIVRNSYLPFSVGRRNCIGSRFALLEMSLFTVHFLKKFRVSTQQNDISMKGFVTLKSNKPIQLLISKI
jgi:cytochrome P450